MYYIFAVIALFTGIISVNDEKTRGMSITSIIIVCITFILKILNTLMINGALPTWLTNGLI